VPEVRALDERHIFMTVPGTSEVLVLDLQSRSWCSATLPTHANDQTTAHGGPLYIWRSFMHTEDDATGRIFDTPANGLVVTFAWP
jgi:hypothetical protein